MEQALNVSGSIKRNNCKEMRGRDMKRSVAVLCALSLLGSVNIVSTAQADDARDRDKLVREINEDVKALGSVLKNVPKDKDSRNIDKASGSLKDITKLIGKLSSIQSESDEAKLIVDTYPKHIKAFGAALANLKKAKAYQYKIDPLEEACEKTEESFSDAVEKLVDEGKDGSEDKIEDTAEKISRSIDDKLDDATDLYKKIDAMARDVKRFSYRKGPWNAPERALDQAADGVVKHMKEALKKAEKVCEPLTSAEKLDFVRKAMSELEEVDENAGSFVEKGEDWFAESRAIFSIDCGAQEKIRQAYCSGDYEPDEKPKLSSYDKVANAEAGEVIKKLKPLLKDYAKLKTEGKEILDRAYDKEVERILGNMKKRKEGLAGLTKGEHLKGSRNPKIQTWINYGKQMHKSLEGKYNCDLKDVKIPGMNKRPDCVSARRCMVYEFKPNFPPAVTEGEQQVKLYAAHINDIAEQILEMKLKSSGYYDLPPADQDEDEIEEALEGDAFLEALWDHKCIDEDGDVSIGFDVITYPKCGSTPIRCEKP